MNNVENEGKLLNINVPHVRNKLKSLKAKKIGDYKFKRYVFDTIPQVENRWVRLRSDGQKASLTVKEILHNNVGGTLEWEIDVSNFDMTLTILEKIGISPKGYQENTREEYELDGVVISIDCWPMLDPYLEVEADSAEQVAKMVEKLGFSESDITGENTDLLYKKIGIDLKKVSSLKFVKT